MEDMMKKISLIFLSLVLVFMVGCSAQSKDETAFLDAVKGKNTTFLNVVAGSFSDDGKTYTTAGAASFVYNFDSAASGTEATYLLGGVAGTGIKFVLDGNTVTLAGVKYNLVAK